MHTANRAASSGGASSGRSDTVMRARAFEPLTPPPCQRLRNPPVWSWAARVEALVVAARFRRRLRAHLAGRSAVPHEDQPSHKNQGPPPWPYKRSGDLPDANTVHRQA